MTNYSQPDIIVLPNSDTQQFVPNQMEISALYTRRRQLKKSLDKVKGGSYQLAVEMQQINDRIEKLLHENRRKLVLVK